jgi:hypothetical protein
MKLFICAVLLSFLFGLAGGPVLAQGPPPPPPPPAPAKDYAPHLWEEFSLPEIGCKIKFPGEPQKTTRQRETGTTRQTTYHLSFGRAMFITYDLVCVELAEAPPSASSLKTFLDGYREGVFSVLLPNANYRITRETEVAVEGYSGKLVQIEIEQKKFLRMKTLIVGSKLYSLMVLTGVYAPNVMGSENNYEKIAMGFLDSFQLIKPADKK